jgi:alkylated DNA repair dioxygenase AlkB
MNLFGQNILPFDGNIEYYNHIFKENDFYYDVLLNKINWINDELIMFGKKITTKRKVAWYAENGLDYTYSKQTKIALPFTNELLEIKKIVEQNSKETFNSCLLNLYHNGNEGMGWHADNEKELKKNGTIASVSFGAARKIVFKHKQTGTKTSVLLENGSLLLMKDETQQYWLHSIPVSSKIKTPRINLTFRTIEK